MAAELSTIVSKSNIYLSATANFWHELMKYYPSLQSHILLLQIYENDRVIEPIIGYGIIDHKFVLKLSQILLFFKIHQFQ